MSTVFGGVMNNEVKVQTYEKMVKIANVSGINIEEIDGRYRVEISKSNPIINLPELIAEEKAMKEMLLKIFPEDREHQSKTEHNEQPNWYYWVDGNDDALVSITRYGENSSSFVEPLICHLFECEETVCEHDDLERLVEVGLCDPSILEEDED